jgi:hypothetical protein
MVIPSQDAQQRQPPAWPRPFGLRQNPALALSRSLASYLDTTCVALRAIIRILVQRIFQFLLK